MNVTQAPLHNEHHVTPRVCVLLPAWNAASTIDATLRSIQRQTETRWQCIVVDDGSSDETAEIVQSVARADSRFRLLQTAHRGLVAALNAGLECSDATLIARMDADDVMHKDRLAHQADALERNAHLSAVGCHVRIFPRARVTPRLREYEQWLNGLCDEADVARDAFIECPIAHPGLMMRRDMARLGYADRGWPEDYDLVLRALAAGRRIGMVPRRLLGWRDRADSLCRSSSVYDVERFTACKAHYLAQGLLSRVSQYVLWGYGGTGRLLRRALAEHAKYPSHIVEVKASRIGQRIHGATVIPIDGLKAVRGVPVIVSVARAGPRAEIRGALARLQFVEGVDFVCAA